MKTPLISIIVPNYNHAPFLQQRLDSVFNQSFQNFEVILLDDCSTDTSREILNRYKDHPKVSNYIVNDINSGLPFIQWKKGIDLAKGEYIWIAESDDYCNATFLEKIMQLFTKNSSIGLGYCQTIDVDEKGADLLHRIKYTSHFQPNIWENNFEMDGRKFVKNYLSVFNVIPNTSAVVFKKELVCNSVFSNSLLKLRMCGDWLFWIKILLKTSIGFLSETLNYFRDHETISRNHHSLNVKKKRLIEEKEIYEFLKYYNIYDNMRINSFYHRWFSLHRFSSISSFSFYQVKLNKTPYFTFFLDFIKYKFIHS